MQVDARGWIFEISDGTTPTPAWLDISGVLSFELNPGEGEEVEDLTVFSDLGDYKSQPMQRGATLTVTGRKIVSAIGVPDPGQLRVDTLGNLKSDAAVGELRFRHELEDEWTVWDAWVTRGTVGGGNNNKASWSAVFHRNEYTTAAVA